MGVKHAAGEPVKLPRAHARDHGGPQDAQGVGDEPADALEARELLGIVD